MIKALYETRRNRIYPRRLRGILLVAISLFNPVVIAGRCKDPVPLRNQRLRQLALGLGIGKDKVGIERNRAIGRAFQALVLDIIGLAENFRPFPSPERRLATRLLARPMEAVIPDAVRDVGEIKLSWHGLETISHPQGSFFEVKAIRGPLLLSTSNHQIIGLIDALALLPFGSSENAHPTLTFITTHDTAISVDTVSYASKRGVALWHILAYEAGSTGELCLGAARLLNPNVLPGKGSLARGSSDFSIPGPTPIFSRTRSLPSGLVPSTNPDPTEVE